MDELCPFAGNCKFAVPKQACAVEWLIMRICIEFELGASSEAYSGPHHKSCEMLKAEEIPSTNFGFDKHNALILSLIV